MEKDLITTNLLGLRAGLSLISKNTDEINREEDQIIDAKNNIQNMRNQIIDAEDELDFFKFKRQKLRLDITIPLDECIDKCNNSLYTANQHFNDSKHPIPDKETFILIFLISITPIMAIIFALLSPLIFSTGEEVSTIFLFLPTLFFSFLVALIISKKSKRKSSLKVYKKYQNEYLQNCCELDKIKKRLIEYDTYTLQEATKREAEIQSLKDTLPSKISPFDDIISKHEENISLLAKKSESIASVLNDTYGFFLMEVDWGNVDLIIHYIETGRANDMKEALQLVDRQRQTEQIVEAIEYAAEVINSHIESAFRRMGSALAEAFSRLDKRLQTANSVLLDKLNEQKDAAEMNTKALEKINHSTQMSNALLEKANTTNERLINDLHYNEKYWRM